jgi:hypothetical protein
VWLLAKKTIKMKGFVLAGIELDPRFDKLKTNGISIKIDI